MAKICFRPRDNDDDDDDDVDGSIILICFWLCLLSVPFVHRHVCFSWHFAIKYYYVDRRPWNNKNKWTKITVISVLVFSSLFWENRNNLPKYAEVDATNKMPYKNIQIIAHTLIYTNIHLLTHMFVFTCMYLCVRTSFATQGNLHL